MKTVTLKKVYAYKLILACLSYKDANDCAKLVEGSIPRRAAKSMNKIEDSLRGSAKDYFKGLDEVLASEQTEIIKSFNLESFQKLSDEEKKAEEKSLNDRLNLAVNAKVAEKGLDKEGLEDCVVELSDENWEFLNKALDKMADAPTLKDRTVYTAICEAVEKV